MRRNPKLGQYERYCLSAVAKNRDWQSYEAFSKAFKDQIDRLAHKGLVQKNDRGEFRVTEEGVAISRQFSTDQQF